MTDTRRLIRAFGAEVLAVPYRLRLKHLGRRPRLFAPLLIHGARGIEIGDDARIEAFALLSTEAGGRLTIGNRFEMAAFARVEADIGYISIGDRSSVNSFCTINGFGGVRIGNGVRIASHCVILSSTHNFADPDVAIEAQGVTAKITVIGDDVWIGAHSVVVGGVEIGPHSVIGAGSIVLNDIPPYSIAAGAPARVVRTRNSNNR